MRGVSHASATGSSAGSESWPRTAD